MVWLKIQDTVSLEEDLKFSDETVEDVVAPEALQQHQLHSDVKHPTDA